MITSSSWRDTGSMKSITPNSIAKKVGFHAVVCMVTKDAWTHFKKENLMPQLGSFPFRLPTQTIGLGPTGMWCGHTTIAGRIP